MSCLVFQECRACGKARLHVVLDLPVLCFVATYVLCIFLYNPVLAVAEWASSVLLHMQESFD